MLKREFLSKHPGFTDGRDGLVRHIRNLKKISVEKCLLYD